MERKPYPSDLTEQQWKLIEPLIPPAKPGGRPRKVNMREVVNAILYLSRTGCAWRMLPHEFPPWGTVHYYYYRRFRLDGLWAKIHDRLREQVRRKNGRTSPRAAASRTLRFHSDRSASVIGRCRAAGRTPAAYWLLTRSTGKVTENRPETSRNPSPKVKGPSSRAEGDKRRVRRISAAKFFLLDRGFRFNVI